MGNAQGGSVLLDAEVKAGDAGNGANVTFTIDFDISRHQEHSMGIF